MDDGWSDSSTPYFNKQLQVDGRMYLIGIDIGTSSTKGVLINKRGKVVSQSRRTHKVERPQPGWAEQDADHIWWRETVEIINNILTTSGVPPSKVAAVGCSGVCPVVLPIDKEGNPLRKAILYSIDSRSAAQIRYLNEKIGPNRILKDSGQPLSSQSILPKLMWLKEHEPDIWLKTKTILGASGYVAYRLCGAMTIDHFAAADGGFGYSMGTFSWDEEAFRLAGINPGVMPRLTWPSEVVGSVSSEAAQVTGLLEGTPVITGTGDALAEMISTGVSECGETALLYGSTLTTMTLIDQGWTHEGFITVPGWKEGQIVTSSVLGSGMSTFSWLRRLLREKTDETLFERYETEAEKVKKGADGLIALPYFTGQRSPELNPLMRGAFVGLSHHHGVHHMMRAAMEGIGFSLRLTLDEIPNTASMRVVGGGVNSRLLLQIVSDICRCTQEVIAGHVGAPLGSAWLAGVGVGMLEPHSYREWIEIGETIPHHETRSVEYDFIYEKYKQVLKQIKPVFNSQ